MQALMIFTETKFKGAFIIDVDLRVDFRGAFARTFCAHEFEEHGLSPHVVQTAISFNKRRGTLRGMHWQSPPHAQAKVVRCTHGAIYDVIVDLRSDSPTFGEHLAVELNEMNRRMLYVPAGFAHGFQTLVDDTEVLYLFDEFYEPSTERGARATDPAFRIAWPVPDPIMNERDRSWADFSALPDLVTA